jgi:hypothetical protein
MTVVEAGAAVAATGKCQYQDAQVIQTSYTVVDPTPPGYLICFTGLQVVGTLNGIITSCITPAAISFGEGSDNVYTGVAHNTLVTKDGALVQREYDVFDYDQGVFASIAKVDPAQSTGAFAGVTGTLLGSPELLHFDNPRGVFANIHITGYLCPPAH